MTVELNAETLHQAGIGSFFRPSQLEPLGISYHRLRQLVADQAVERVALGSLPACRRRTDGTLFNSLRLRPRSQRHRLPPFRAPSAWDRLTTPSPSLDRYSAQSKASCPDQCGRSSAPLQRRGLDLWRPGNEIRRGARPHHHTGAHRRRLFPLRAPDRQGGRLGGPARSAARPKGDHRRAGAHA